MSHLQDEKLVSLVFCELTGGDLDACTAHLQDCPECSEGLERLDRAVALLEKAPAEPPPPYAWLKLKDRVEWSGASRDWDEPAWMPLVFGSAAGILLIILLIFAAGGWLEKAAAWQVVRTWPLAREVGPRSLIAVVFFSAGALVTLALTPIFWWESRQPRNHAVK